MGNDRPRASRFSQKSGSSALNWQRSPSAPRSGLVQDAFLRHRNRRSANKYDFRFWHFSEEPTAASKGRSWIQSGLRQTAARRVCPPVSAHSSARESLGIPQIVLRWLSYRARFATGSCRRRNASGVGNDCRRQQLPHTSSERPASAALLKTLSYVIFHDTSSFAKNYHG